MFWMDSGMCDRICSIGYRNKETKGTRDEPKDAQAAHVGKTSNCRECMALSKHHAFFLSV